jgi:hypothetical protein
MTVKLDAMPSTDVVKDAPAAPNMVKVATLRIVTTRRRLDRFWQMIRDEAPSCYEVGTFSIPGEEDLKLVVVDVMKKPTEAHLEDSDTVVFSKYRFPAKEIQQGSDPTDLGEMGMAAPYNYVAPQPKNAVGDGFV